MKCSKNLVSWLIVISFFVLTIQLIGSVEWLSNKGATNCQTFLNYSSLYLGLFSLLCLANLFSVSRFTCLYYMHLFIVFSLFLIVFYLAIFALVVTKEGHGKSLSNRGYKEYSLGEYSHWFQKRVNVSETWKSIKTCLVHGNVCKKLGDSNIPQDTFFKKHLSPIQSGCCKPPENCGFTYVGPTNWTKTGTPTNPDCNVWDDNPNILCYDCTSCKAGFLHSLKGDWKKVVVVTVILLTFHIIVYTIGCCAFRSERWDNSKSKVYNSHFVEA